MMVIGGTSPGIHAAREDAMVTADEFSRSARGAAAFLNRHPDALARFEISLPAFWRSFAAISITVPAYVVGLGLARPLAATTGRLFDDPGLALAIGLGHLAAFLAVPLAMIPIARRFGFGDRYVPFVIVTNWIWAFAALALALPGALLLLGLATSGLAVLFASAFGFVALFVHWHASRTTLRIGPGLAMLTTGFGLVLWFGTALILEALVSG